MHRKYMIPLAALILVNLVYAQLQPNRVLCGKNLDCGQSEYGPKTCVEADVYQRVDWWVCVNPKTKKSLCEFQSENKLVEVCPKDQPCILGACGGLDNSTTTQTNRIRIKQLNPVAASIKDNPNLNVKATDTLLGNLSVGGEDKSLRVFVKLRQDEYHAKQLASLKKKSPPSEPSEAVDVFTEKKKVFRQKQQQVLSRVGGRGLNVRHRFATSNVFSANVTQEALMRLLSDPQVEQVTMVGEAQPHLSQSIPLVTASDSWDIQVNGVYVKGEGYSVCVLDTGVNYSHTNLGGCSTADFLAGDCAKVPYGYDFYSTDTNPMDSDGHGTHVAGTIASDHGTYSGVAPEAKIIAMRVCAATCPWDDVADAIEECTAQSANYNITVITMSLGSDATFCNAATCASALPSAVSNAIEAAEDAGIFLDASTGNDADTSGISAPACHADVVSVGAVYDYDGPYLCWGGGSCPGANTCDDPESNVEVDKVICITNRCSLLDVMAPGYAIYSTEHGVFKTEGGTSMAAPHVAGAAVLLQQYALNQQGRRLTPAQVKNLLVDNGDSVTRGSLTKPRIDIYAAIQAASSSEIRLTDYTAPQIGSAGSTFSFNVTYSDADNDTPATLQATVDGSTDSLSEVDASDNDYTDGKDYYFETALATYGLHRYMFNASDYFNTQQTSFFTGPFVAAASDCDGGATPPYEDDWLISSAITCQDSGFVASSIGHLNITNTLTLDSAHVYVNQSLLSFQGADGQLVLDDGILVFP